MSPHRPAAHESCERLQPKTKRFLWTVSTFSDSRSMRCGLITASCYSADNQGPHRCCPLRIKLRTSTADKSGHGYVLHPYIKCLFSGPTYNIIPHVVRGFWLSPQSTLKRNLDRFIRFSTTHARQTDGPRYCGSNRPHTLNFCMRRSS